MHAIAARYQSCSKQEKTKRKKPPAILLARLVRLLRLLTNLRSGLHFDESF